jgi:hypothetical protein
VAVDDDGTLPDFSTCERDGHTPIVLVGRFGAQLDWCTNYLRDKVNLAEESVAFLHPKGGGFFDEVRRRLQRGVSIMLKSNNVPIGPTGRLTSD